MSVKTEFLFFLDKGNVKKKPSSNVFKTKFVVYISVLSVSLELHFPAF